LEDVLCYPTNSLQIYNRWGVLVLKLQIIIIQVIILTEFQEEEQLLASPLGFTGTYFYILNYTSIEGTGGVTNNTKDGYLYLTR
jgi:hypothetical protein